MERILLVAMAQKRSDFLIFSSSYLLLSVLAFQLHQLMMIFVIARMAQMNLEHLLVRTRIFGA